MIEADGTPADSAWEEAHSGESDNPVIPCDAGLALALHECQQLPRLALALSGCGC
ncbi:hypothetical protein GCM10025738_27120 [Microbacterium fluvii]